MTKPTQSTLLYRGLPTGPGFTREYEVQEGVPIDGTHPNLRNYSPFLVRVLPPMVLGQGDMNVLSPGNVPTRGAPESGGVRSSNRDVTTYSTSIRGVSDTPAALRSYQGLVHAGLAIPGLTTTSVATIQSAYNQALFTQVFGPTVRASLTGTPGDRPTVITPFMANDLSALSILLQVKQIMAVPPLILLINPQSMRVQYGKIAQHQERSRYGYIYQAWGEELVKIGFTFKIGAYVTGGGGRGNPSGVQRASRANSASFQQLQNMLTIFQSGGYIQDTLYNSRAHLLVGNIAIEYDQKTYVGHFDTFSFTEAEEQQNGGLEFEMDFTAIRVFDHAESPSTVTPLTGPSVPGGSFKGRGTISRAGNQGGGQFLSAPTIGFGATNPPPQPWSGATVTDQGVQPAPGIVTSRR